MINTGLLFFNSVLQVIPATPKEKREGKGGRRRRVKKQVDKTYMDEEG